MKRFLKFLLGLNAASILKTQSSLFLSTENAFNGAWRTESRELANIPKVSLRDILGDREPLITYSISKTDDGSLPLHQSFALLAILAAEQPKEVLEIGTYMGQTTKMMAETVNAIIHTVDLPQSVTESNIPKDDFHLIENRVVGSRFKGAECEKRIKQYFVDTAEWDFKCGNPTFFFIDGSHTYEYCKNDSEKCLSIAPKDSVFIWHDCDDGHQGIIRFNSEWINLGREIVRIEGTPFAYWKNN